MVEYKLKGEKILKDGHTMLLKDVVRDLQRKSHLEKHRLDMEAFMIAVANKLNCLPSFAGPHPNEGNDHIMKKLSELVEDIT